MENVTRKLALDIFNLSEGFTPEDVTKAYRRLVRIAHPDYNGDARLFDLIVSCKEVLLNPHTGVNDNAQTSRATVRTNKAPTEQSPKKYKISLDDLYRDFYFLHLTPEFPFIVRIDSTAEVSIFPCRNPISRERMKLELHQSFKEFCEANFEYIFFQVTVTLPEKLKKYKKFIVRVKFLGKKFYFKLNMERPNFILKCNDIWKFDSIIRLTFK